MFPLLAEKITVYYGPFRLLGSTLVLLGFGSAVAAFVVWLGLPHLWHLLPRDRGKKWVKQGEESQGKPTGAGIVIVCLLLPVLLCVLPFSGPQWQVVGCLFLVMLTGYVDDASEEPWGEVRKGLLDLGLAIMTSFALCQGRPVTMWWPLLKGPLENGGVLMPVWAFVAISSVVLWVSINATNCSDGIDGLAGSLTLLSLVNLGGFLYVAVGHVTVAEYLILPHNPDGARWAVLIAASSGAFAGYLWHNAKPSAVLMGDAGSRFLGLLIGVAVMAAGNPFLIVVVAPMILVNGASGLGKLLVLRFMRKMGFDTTPPDRREGNGDAGPQHVVVRLLHSVRFPFHDHCRRNLHWSDPQVLVRFMLLQTFLTPLLLVLMVKVR
ncbi:MAG: phospho-N-acetylmuramoyl-pentapeptide-transferase [Victivallales bacterium]|jgi:phospho-N-acetylmuramoyl-pentapeptide-transferase|nr:phospho-N-acetylmuramoyl-pentapeptide-transferase [Victivallales bacterium]